MAKSHKSTQSRRNSDGSIDEYTEIYDFETETNTLRFENSEQNDQP